MTNHTIILIQYYIVIPYLPSNWTVFHSNLSFTLLSKQFCKRKAHISLCHLVIQEFPNCFIVLHIDSRFFQLLLNCFLMAPLYVQFSSVQLLSRVRLFSTPWITARQASLSITNSRSSLRLNVHRVSDAIQPSHPLPYVFLSNSNFFPGFTLRLCKGCFLPSLSNISTLLP